MPGQGGHEGQLPGPGPGGRGRCTAGFFGQLYRYAVISGKQHALSGLKPAGQSDLFPDLICVHGGHMFDVLKYCKKEILQHTGHLQHVPPGSGSDHRGVLCAHADQYALLHTAVHGAGTARAGGYAGKAAGGVPGGVRGHVPECSPVPVCDAAFCIFLHAFGGWPADGSGGSAAGQCLDAERE